MSLVPTFQSPPYFGSPQVSENLTVLASEDSKGYSTQIATLSGILISYFDTMRRFFLHFSPLSVRSRSALERVFD